MQSWEGQETMKAIVMRSECMDWSSHKNVHTHASYHNITCMNGIIYACRNSYLYDDNINLIPSTAMARSAATISLFGAKKKAT
jgi:hypothetical protein